MRGIRELNIIPCTYKTACNFVNQHHRHHIASQGCKFCLGLMNDNKLCGVAICGRPVSRHLDNGFTLEINRLCTDGTKNACSMLYGACCRVAKAMEYKKVITYIHNLPIAEPYGEVIETECQYTFDGEQCKYATTGCDRTGCMFCAFGAHLEKGITRFQRDKITHPIQYNYCMNGDEFVNGLWQPNKQGLGMRYVFDELNKLYGDDFIRYE